MPRLLIFQSTISLSHKKFLDQKFMIKSLHVIWSSSNQKSLLVVRTYALVVHELLQLVIFMTKQKSLRNLFEWIIITAFFPKISRRLGASPLDLHGLRKLGSLLIDPCLWSDWVILVYSSRLPIQTFLFFNFWKTKSERLIFFVAQKENLRYLLSQSRNCSNQWRHKSQQRNSSN